MEDTWYTLGCKKKETKKGSYIGTYRFILRVPLLELLVSSRLRKRDWEHRTNASQRVSGVSDLTPSQNDGWDETTSVIISLNSHATARPALKATMGKLAPPMPVARFLGYFSSHYDERTL